MTLKKKRKVKLEIFDKQSQEWVQAVGDKHEGIAIEMHEFIMAQIEVYSVIDDMTLHGVTVEKN